MPLWMLLKPVTPATTILPAYRPALATSAVPLFFSCWRKPRVLMVVQPTLFCTPLALLFCKLFGIKSLLHVQDFELDAMFGLSMSKSNGQGRLARLAFRVERFILRSFDAVSTISHSMMAKLIATAESDPRKPSLVTPLVVEFEGYHGHVE